MNTDNQAAAAEFLHGSPDRAVRHSVVTCQLPFSAQPCHRCQLSGFNTGRDVVSNPDVGKLRDAFRWHLKLAHADLRRRITMLMSRIGSYNSYAWALIPDNTLEWLPPTRETRPVPLVRATWLSQPFVYCASPWVRFRGGWFRRAAGPAWAARGGGTGLAVTFCGGLVRILDEVSRSLSEYLLIPGLTDQDCTPANVSLSAPLVRHRAGGGGACPSRPARQSAVNSRPATCSWITGSGASSHSTTACRLPGAEVHALGALAVPGLDHERDAVGDLADLGRQPGARDGQAVAGEGCDAGDEEPRGERVGVQPDDVDAAPEQADG
jgi:hypothetical protein